MRTSSANAITISVLSLKDIRVPLSSLLQDLLWPLLRLNFKHSLIIAPGRRSHRWFAVGPVGHWARSCALHIEPSSHQRRVIGAVIVVRYRPDSPITVDIC